MYGAKGVGPKMCSCWENMECMRTSLLLKLLIQNGFVQIIGSYINPPTEFGLNLGVVVAGRGGGAYGPQGLTKTVQTYEYYFSC